ncbi:uncharacterized protein LOC135334570 isoform X2 [Halichondria panicea]|uniref:uncharacterized protein LOC135334570 isoform X2 n=1 Tax=Halichondria panicea TaxID=6063 RepID=UPI00312B4C78
MASKDATKIEVIRDEIEGTNLGLGTSDLQLIYEALFEVRAKWRPIGLELRLTPGTLDAIEQGKINPSDRLEAVLLDWLRVTIGATWEQLIDALRSALVREIRLAEKLELKYCSPETGHGEKRKYRSDDEQQLTNDIKTIEKKFANLRRESLKKKKKKKKKIVKLVSLVALLTSYRTSRAVIHKQSDMLLAEQQEDLRKAASVDEIFVIISPFWSFLDFEILEDVINKFGTESDQRDLATYFTELRKFLNTWKVEPCKISRLNDNKKSVKFCFKLDTESLAIYRDLKAAIARILKVSVYAVHLHSIEDGSIQLIFFFLGIVQLSFHECDQIAQIIPSVLKVSSIHGSTNEVLFEREDQNPSPPHSQSLPVVPVVGTIVDRIVGSIIGAVAGGFNVGGSTGVASGDSGAIHSNIPPPQIRQESTGHEELEGKTIQERQQKKWYQRLFSWRTSQRAGEEDEPKTTPSPGETVEPSGQHTSVTEKDSESSPQGERWYQRLFARLSLRRSDRPAHSSSIAPPLYPRLSSSTEDLDIEGPFYPLRLRHRFSESSDSSDDIYPQIYDPPLPYPIPPQNVIDSCPQIDDSPQRINIDKL